MKLHEVFQDSYYERLEDSYYKNSVIDLDVVKVYGLEIWSFEVRNAAEAMSYPRQSIVCRPCR